MQKRKVMWNEWSTVKTSGCSRRPFVKERGHSIRNHDFGVPFNFFTKYGLLEPKATDIILIDHMLGADVICFQRQYASESLASQRLCKEKGKATVFHCDDNVWEIPAGNPARDSYKPGSMALYNYEKLMSQCHAVTTSTPYLADLCRRFNKNVYIFRNLVDPVMTNFLCPGRDNPNEIRIGWTGTAHHHDDIKIIEPVVNELLKQYSNVKFVFMGYGLTESGKPILQSNIGRWEFYDFVPVDAFYPSLANLDFDIGIAPLEDNRFNKGKTGRKAQEYAMLNIPMVLSPLSPYKDWVHGETCLKPKENRVTEWFKDLKWMIEHKIDREKMAKKAYEQVMRNHDINKWIGERAGVYAEIVDRVKKGDLK